MSVARRALRDAVVLEYLDKLPEFLTLPEFARVCTLTVSQLHEMSGRGVLRMTIRSGTAGIIPRENADFLRRRSLLQLPTRLAMGEFNATERTVIVSGTVYSRLADAAARDGISVAQVLEHLSQHLRAEEDALAAR